MSNYNQVCGIADYTASLVKAMPSEHEIKIIAPKLTGTHHSLRPVGAEDSRIERLYNATIWDDIVGIELPRIDEIASQSDIFHIQFQDAVFHHEWLWYLVERLKGRTRLAITLHDTCLGKIWPMLGSFNYIFTMKPEVKAQVPQAHLVPMPVYNLQPVIKGFGLGRSKHHEIQAVCDSIGYKYEYVKAEDKWLPLEELIKWLRDSEGIVLYYDEVTTAGSSAGARTALSTRRPVFVNRVTWFNDISEDIVTKFNDNEDLKQKLLTAFDKPYLRENSFEEVAKIHIGIYTP